MKIIKEVREFAVKGNVVDMAVGIVIGAAFTTVVNSTVKDIFAPVVSLFTVGIRFENMFLTLREGAKGGPYAALTDAQADGAITLNAGLFLNALISFAIVATLLYFLVKGINRLRRPVQPTADPVATRECPRCFSVISLKATRCPQCTSDITA